MRGQFSSWAIFPRARTAVYGKKNTFFTACRGPSGVSGLTPHQYDRNVVGLGNAATMIPGCLHHLQHHVVHVEGCVLVNDLPNALLSEVGSGFIFVLVDAIRDQAEDIARLHVNG